MAIVFDLPVELCLERNRGRATRSLPDGVIRRQHGQMQRSMSELEKEGFDEVQMLGSATEVDAAVVAS